ncbi:hypothetical protein FRX31_035391 [Thalictrum thalictroides]|uniref:Transmembrane protein n=1 Tax=Thalictrum thalictroides TaxID=46969 RepID=A0A7J6URD9_THATH|nr:hypothetical protein FRX31_035391 [Thalictrum thalictroides]
MANSHNVNICQSSSCNSHVDTGRLYRRDLACIYSLYTSARSLLSKKRAAEENASGFGSGAVLVVMSVLVLAVILVVVSVIFVMAWMVWLFESRHRWWWKPD